MKKLIKFGVITFSALVLGVTAASNNTVSNSSIVYAETADQGPLTFTVKYYVYDTEDPSKHGTVLGQDIFTVNPGETIDVKTIAEAKYPEYTVIEDLGIYYGWLVDHLDLIGNDGIGYDLQKKPTNPQPEDPTPQPQPEDPNADGKQDPKANKPELTFTLNFIESATRKVIHSEVKTIKPDQSIYVDDIIDKKLFTDYDLSLSSGTVIDYEAIELNFSMNKHDYEFYLYKPQNSKPDANAGGQQEPKADTPKDSKPDANAGGQQEPKADTPKDSKPDANAGGQQEPKADTPKDSKPDANAGGQQEPKADTPKDSKPDANAGGQQEPKADTPKDSKPDAKGKTEAKAAANTAAGDSSGFVAILIAILAAFGLSFKRKTN